MIDTNLPKLENNLLLEFSNKVNVKTGELGVYLNAFYRGLEFKIYESTETHPNRRVTVEGSLHKYWNNGMHNFNDFGINELHEVISDIENKFCISSENCVLKSLEIGVNIIPPVKTKTVLKSCIMHKTNVLKWVFTKDEGNYVQTKNQRHYVKIYDKKTHYANKGFVIDNEIMRIEKKWCKMVELNGKGIFTLHDLIRYDLSNFKQDLQTMWNDVLFCDLQTTKGTKYENKYNNINWWGALNYERFKYHTNNLNKLINSDPKNLKNIVSNLISKKVDFLNTKTPEINPLHIGLKTVVSNLEKADKNRRFCKVTGLNISMQRSDSFLLADAGLRYYLKTDVKIYNEVKRKYLSKKWVDADEETEIKEIYHNIRNTISNQRIKQNRIYTPTQFQLFDIGA